MTEVAEVKTIGDVERIVHGSGMWDGTGPVEFSDDGLMWSEAWAPTVDEPRAVSGDIVRSRVLQGHPEFARVTVYRKDVRIPTTVTIRWDEQRPRENEEWAAKWDAAPTRHFGRTARMVAFRQTFRDILGDVSIEDEERTTGPAPEAETPERDWLTEFALARTVEAVTEVHAECHKAKAYTTSNNLDVARRNRIRQLENPAREFTGIAAEMVQRMDAIRAEFDAAWEPAPGPSDNAQGPATPERLAELNEMVTRPRPQDHLPGNRASRRAKKKRGGRR